MKKALIILIGMIFTIVAPIYASSFGSEYDKAVSFFQSQSEPKAMDAIWETESILKIGIVADGENQTSYANHVCEILYNEGFRGKGVKVSIIDIEKLAFTNELVILGSASCE